MADISKFDSRTGYLNCSNAEVYRFVSDIRNFERFIPEGAVTDFMAEKEKCSFRVGMLGSVDVSITDKTENKKVVFSGKVLQTNDFDLFLTLDQVPGQTTEVKVVLSATLNPMFRMVAAEPINKFLEKLITEMENFREWKDIK